MPTSQPVWWFPGDPGQVWGLFISHSCRLYEKPSSMVLLQGVFHAALGTEAGVQAPLPRPEAAQAHMGKRLAVPVAVSTRRGQRGGWEVGMARDTSSTPCVCDRGKAVAPVPQFPLLQGEEGWGEGRLYPVLWPPTCDSGCSDGTLDGVLMPTHLSPRPGPHG